MFTVSPELTVRLFVQLSGSVCSVLLFPTLRDSLWQKNKPLMQVDLEHLRTSTRFANLLAIPLDATWCYTTSF